MTIKADNTTRLRLLEERIAQLEAQLAGALRPEARGGQEHLVRMGKTAGTSYPAAPANTFDLVYEEWDYTAAPGNQTPTIDELSASPMSVVHDPHPNRYLVEGERCLILQQPNRRRVAIPLATHTWLARVVESSGLPPRDDTALPAAGTISLRKAASGMPSVAQVEARNMGNDYLLAEEWCRAGQDVEGNWLAWPLMTTRRRRVPFIVYDTQALGTLKYFTAASYGGTETKWDAYVNPTGGAVGQPVISSRLAIPPGGPDGIVTLTVHVSSPAAPVAAPAGMYVEVIVLALQFGGYGLISIPFYYGEANAGYPAQHTTSVVLPFNAAWAANIELHEFGSTLVHNAITDYTLGEARLSFIPGGDGSGVGAEP